MKIFKNILYILSFAIFFSCNKDDDKIDFTFLQINDVYEIAPIQGGKYGGMARVETLHQNLLKENKNTMLFLAGDFLNPSLIGTLKVDDERVRGKQMVEVMNAMNFDAVAFGNHEFDLSQQDLQKRLNESNFPWISSNVKLKTNGKSIPFYKEREGKRIPLKGTLIKEIIDEDGTTIKIGFISVCIPSNPKEYVEYGNMFVKARSAYAAIKDSVDVVFGLTHVKINNDKRIAKLLPNIPLIMGGHEHTNKYEKVGNSIITKADANAKTAYIHRITYDKKTKKTIIDSKLQEITDSIVADQKVGEIVDKWQTILTTKIKDIIPQPNEVIYNAKIPLDGRDTPIRSEPTNLGKVITAAMSYSFNHKVDAAIVNGGSIRIDDELEGSITAVDIFRVLPYGGAVLKADIKGRLFKRVLDYGELAKGTGAYLHHHNISKKNNIWYIKGKPLLTTKTYTVAFSDYLLKGFDIPFLSSKDKSVTNVSNPKEKELSFDIRRAVVAYLKTQE